MRDEHVALLRRHSGGGAVYHDLGNSNYSFIEPRSSFDKRRAAEIVANALRSRLGIPSATVNDRADIVVRGSCKVSGSAFRLMARAACYHGTMLLNADLKRLQRFLLAANGKKMMHITSDCVESVGAPVANLNISHEQFCTAVIAEFEKHLKITATIEDFDCAIRQNPEVLKFSTELEVFVFNGRAKSGYTDKHHHSRQNTSIASCTW